MSELNNKEVTTKNASNAICLNRYTESRIISSVNYNEANTTIEACNIEIDSHANMAVFGRDSFVINVTGQVAEVSAFSNAIGGLSNIPIVDQDVYSTSNECTLRGVDADAFGSTLSDA